jgi:hypothetical protein
MTIESLVKELKQNLPVGTVLDNPKEGTGNSKVIKYRGDDIIYRRADTEFPLDLMVVAETYEDFKGRTVTTSDLGKYNPSVYGESGHGCNKTFFMMIMKKMGLTKTISGSGVPGDPFRIQL